MADALAPDELEQRVARAKADPGVSQYNLLYSVLDSPAKNPVLFDIMLNPDDGVPLLVEPGPVADRHPGPVRVQLVPRLRTEGVRGPFMIWEGVRGPKKMIMGRA